MIKDDERDLKIFLQQLGEMIDFEYEVNDF